MLRNNDVFIVVGICAATAAFCTALALVASGFASDNASSGLVAALIIGLFSLAPFLVAFSFLGLLFNAVARRVRSPLFRWLYFPIASAAVGYGIPFVVGLIAGSPRIAAVSGFAAGLVGAWMWGWLLRRNSVSPSAAP